MTDTAIVYPFPMHLSQGYTYHLSILQFVHALSKINTVYLMTLDSERQIQGILSQQFGHEKPVGLKIVTIQNEYLGLKSNTLFFRLSALTKIREIANRYANTVIYTRNIKLASFLFPLKKSLLKNLHFVFECHQIYSINLAMEKKFTQARRECSLEQKVYKHADLTFVNTKLLQILLEKEYKTAIQKIPLAVADSDVANDPLKIGLDQRPYDFVYTGSFSHWKGVHILVEALILMRDQDWSGKAILVGCKSREFPEWQMAIKERHAESFIEIKEQLPRQVISNILDQSKIGVIPNILEDDSILGTSPLKLYDYAARGLHLVCTQVPALQTEISLTDTTWAEPESPEALASALTSALTNYDSPSLSNWSWAKQNTWTSRANRVMLEIDELNNSSAKDKAN